jgi:hypothetical protein
MAPIVITDARSIDALRQHPDLHPTTRDAVYSRHPRRPAKHAGKRGDVPAVWQRSDVPAFWPADDLTGPSLFAQCRSRRHHASSCPVPWSALSATLSDDGRTLKCKLPVGDAEALVGARRPADLLLHLGSDQFRRGVVDVSYIADATPADYGRAIATVDCFLRLQPADIPKSSAAVTTAPAPAPSSAKVSWADMD